MITADSRDFSLNVGTMKALGTDAAIIYQTVNDLLILLHKDTVTHEGQKYLPMDDGWKARLFPWLTPEKIEELFVHLLKQDALRVVCTPAGVASYRLTFEGE